MRSGHIVAHLGVVPLCCRYLRVRFGGRIEPQQQRQDVLLPIGVHPAVYLRLCNYLPSHSQSHFYAVWRYELSTPRLEFSETVGRKPLERPLPLLVWYLHAQRRRSTRSQLPKAVREYTAGFGQTQSSRGIYFNSSRYSLMSIKLTRQHN